MLFKDVIGQEEAKQRLIAEVKEGRIPHAQLICGPEGTGKLPLAIAYARYICCENRGEQDACGICPTCVKFNKLIHPDLHFVFPVIKKKAGKDTVCDDFIADWRNFVLQNPYFNLNHWLKEMGAENQQAQIFVKESDEIVRKLSFEIQSRRLQNHDYMASRKDECGMQQQTAEVTGRASCHDRLFISIRRA